MVKHAHSEMGAGGANGGAQMEEEERGRHTHHGYRTSGAGRRVHHRCSVGQGTSCRGQGTPTKGIRRRVRAGGGADGGDQMGGD